MNTQRAFSYLKSEIRSRAIRNGTVSAWDVRNVMRRYFSGISRGAWVTNAFRELISEGFLVSTDTTVVNPDNGHKVVVYKINTINT
jgi:hypothetical protein